MKYKIGRGQGPIQSLDNCQGNSYHHNVQNNCRIFLYKADLKATI